MNPNQTNTCNKCGYQNGAHDINCPLFTTFTTTSGSSLGSIGIYPYPGTTSNPNINSSGTMPYAGWNYTVSASEFICVVCGEKESLTIYALNNEPYLCANCKKKRDALLIETMVPKDSKEHCPHCHFHVKACKCPEAEKMHDLEK